MICWTYITCTYSFVRAREEHGNERRKKKKKETNTSSSFESVALRRAFLSLRIWLRCREKEERSVTRMSQVEKAHEWVRVRISL